MYMPLQSYDIKVKLSKKLQNLSQNSANLIKSSRVLSLVARILMQDLLNYNVTVTYRSQKEGPDLL